MKILSLLVLVVIFSKTSVAQKPAIDSSVYRKWPFVLDPGLSDDGQYAFYSIHNEPIGSSTLVVQALSHAWNMKIPSATTAKMATSSRKIIFFKGQDSLGLLSFDDSVIQYIPKVSSYRLVKCQNEEYLGYQLKSPAGEFIVLQLESHDEVRFKNVTNYLFSDNGQILLLDKRPEKDSLAADSLIWVELPRLTAKAIFNGSSPDNFVFDKNNDQLAFVVNDAVAKKNSIWYYRVGMETSQLIANYNPGGFDSCFSIDQVQKFTYDGSGIFFTLKKDCQPPAPKKGAVSVDIWSYTDARLQSHQLWDLRSNNSSATPNFVSILRLSDGRVLRLEQENDKIVESPFNAKGNFVLVRHSEGRGDVNEQYWSKKAQETVFLVSTAIPSRVQIKDRSIIFSIAEISPEGNFLIYYDRDKANYFSYEINTGLFRNITSGGHVDWTANNDVPIARYDPAGLAGYLKGDTDVLIYSRNDIFQVSMKNGHRPFNLTRGYRNGHRLQFRCAIDHHDSVFYPNERLILNVFDWTTKDNGFFAIVLGKERTLERLTMQPQRFMGTSEDDGFAFGQPQPVKAKAADAYIVQRMSSNESWNFYWTSNFNTFIPISDCHPERAYNWLTAELITWKTLDGSFSQGILYKPEDFDPKKKYPVIFYYYERYSNGLNEFLLPTFNTGALNIPEYVSNGYLVFVPDIHFKTGFPGKSVLNSVLSAAGYLKRFPWVDPSKLGIQGHSLGGFETYYLVTHTNIFAAAQAGEGITDILSAYGCIYDNAGSKAIGFEGGQYRIGSTPWARPDLYVENNPILFADKVSTPLLIMDNKDDFRVPFAQGVEMFTALRRMGKKVWLLQYDGNGHLVLGKAARDFTIRSRQFFDHYLRGAPAPKWMVEGIPAMNKGVDDGLELEPLGVEPGPGLLIRREQKKFK